MAMFRLYMKYLLSSYTKHTWAVYVGKGGGKVGTRLCCVGYMSCFIEHYRADEPHDFTYVLLLVLLLYIFQ